MNLTTKITRFLMIAAVPVALAACSEKTQEETGEAAAAAGNDIENAGERVENSMEQTGDNIEAAAERTGDKIEAGAAEARQETGEALEEAGQDLQNPK